MSIERNEAIKFHEKGTLTAVTRWIAAHHEGIAEWFKNVRRQYQVDRADVADDQRTAVARGHPRKARTELGRWFIKPLSSRYALSVLVNLPVNGHTFSRVKAAGKA